MKDDIPDAMDPSEENQQTLPKSTLDSEFDMIQEHEIENSREVGEADDTYLVEEDLEENSEIFAEEPSSINQVLEMDDDNEGKEIDQLEEGEETMLNEEENESADDSVQRFLGHSDSVYCVSMHPQLGVVASGGGDDKAFLWDSTDGKTLFELSGHKDSVTSVQFNHNGKLLATSSYDGTIKIWETESGKLLQTLEGPTEAIEWSCWHPKGNVVLAGSQDGTCWMWLSSGTCMNVFAGHKGSVTCGMFSWDGKLVISGSEDGSARVWDPKTAITLHNFQGHGYHSDAVVSLHTHPNNIAVSGSQDCTSKVFHLGNGKVLGTLQGHEDSVETVEFSFCFPWIASGSLDKNVIIWDFNTLQQRLSFKHEEAVIKLHWHPSEPLVFTCSMDNTIRLWDARNGRSERVWHGHKQPVLDFALNKDASVLVSASDDQSALVFHRF